MNLKEIEAAWNSNAPENNQWDSILPEEQIEFAQMTNKMTIDDVMLAVEDCLYQDDRYDMTGSAVVSLKQAIEQYAKDASEKMRAECAKVCRSHVDLRGANEHHKYMADKCAMEIEKLNEPSA